jgi:transcription termination factor NusB
MGQRRKAREMAVQCLYSLEFSEVDKEYREYGLLNEYPEILLSLAKQEHIQPNSPVCAFAERAGKKLHHQY